MAYTLVRANTVAGVNNLAGPLSVTCVSSTAHNLLVLAVGAVVGTGFAGITGPGGSWQQAVLAQSSGSGGGSAIFYLPDCPSGTTSASISWGSGTAGYVAGQILEFNDAGGANPSPLDVTGTKVTGNPSNSPQAIATGSATTQAHELAVSVLTGSYFGSATKDTINAGTGFTQAGQFNTAAKQFGHNAFDYQLDTGASGVTPSDSMTFTGPFIGSWGVIATFAIFTAAPAGLLPQLLRQRAPLSGRHARETHAAYRS